MHTTHQQDASAYVQVSDGKITMDSSFDGTLNLNLSGKPYSHESNLDHPHPVSIRVTAAKEEINIPFSRDQITELYEKLQELDENTDLFDE